MEASEKVNLTKQQQRILMLLFKFRFVTAPSLAQVLNIHRVSLYEVLEHLVRQDLVVKVYEESWRIDRRPAYYYLSKSGVSAVRGLLDVKEPVVHALYKNGTATDQFIKLCIEVLACYTPIKQNIPSGSDLFTKTEINRFKQFPKNRPDLYVRTPDGREAMIVFVQGSQPYVIKKRLDEIITHNEDEGWDGSYPRIAFVLKDESSKNSFLYKTKRLLDNMGFDETELTVLASTIKAVAGGQNDIWSNALFPKKLSPLLS